jgi:hypothetical protein
LGALSGGVVREMIAQWSISAYQFLIPFAWVGLAIVVLILLPMGAFKSTRSIAGTGLFIASFLFGVTTWLLGAGITFSVFGWLGLIIGLFIFGIGVVPIAIFAAFFKLHSVEIGVSLLVMAVIVIGARMGGAMLMEHSAKSAAN